LNRLNDLNGWNSHESARRQRSGGVELFEKIDDLWIARTDGKLLRQVAGATFAASNHTSIWSPGGKMLAYERGGATAVGVAAAVDRPVDRVDQ